MRAGVGEQRHDVQVLAERAGPAVGQQQRQRRRPAARLVHQMDHLPVHHRPRVRQPVQPHLERGGVEPLPVGQHTRQP